MERVFEAGLLLLVYDHSCYAGKEVGCVSNIAISRLELSQIKQNCHMQWPTNPFNRLSRRLAIRTCLVNRRTLYIIFL